MIAYINCNGGEFRMTNYQVDLNNNSDEQALIRKDLNAGLRHLQERWLRLQQKEEGRLQERAHVLVDNAVDKYELKELPQIDCKSRLDLCKGHCCKLTFPLSFQDLDEGILKWYYSKPYLIRQNDNGYCVHHDCDSRLCRIYENRPAICRTYDCRNDKRIWIDFERRIPAPEKELQENTGYARGFRWNG